MLDFILFSQHCAPSVHPDTMYRLVRVESSFNPLAIGVVGGRLDRQPRTLVEALAITRWLGSHGYNYSVGLTQINQRNFAAQGLDETTAFDPCRNLYAGSSILSHCYRQALQRIPETQRALRAALSCYESGNFNTGLKDGYVLKLINATSATPASYTFPGATIHLSGAEHHPFQASDGAFTIAPASSKASPPRASLR